AAWEARRKDPRRRRDKIGAGAPKRELQQITQRDTAEHGDEHQPSRCLLARQKQIACDCQRYDYQHYDAAETCQIASRLLNPCRADRSRWIAVVTEGKNDASVERG